jgi:DNA-directed RNA polymerase specialized sigma24 family protein
MTPRVSAGRLRAQRELERDYEALKPSTLRSLASKLRARSLSVPDADLEAYYNQAWHALFEQMSDGASIENTGGFLVQVAYRRALDDLRRSGPPRADLADVEGRPLDDDALQRLDDRRRLREFVEALRDELDERERTAASLCYVHGYTRPQAAQAMGLTEGRMKKVMDDVSKTVGRFTREIVAGTRCEHRQSSNKAYAIGLLDPDGSRYTSVRAHLDDCSACRADVLRMRGLAIVAPPVLLPWGLALAAGAIGGGGAAGAGAGKRSRTTQAVAAGVVVAVIAAIVVALLAFTGGDPTQDSVAQAPVATTPARAATTPAASAPTPATAAPQTETKASKQVSKAKRQSTSKAQRKRRRATARAATATAATSSAAPVATATAEAAPPVPAPAPAPAPVAQPAPAPSPPPVDAYQEFGVEP